MMMNLLQALVVMLLAIAVAAGAGWLFSRVKVFLGERATLGVMLLLMFGLCYHLVVTP